MRSPAFGEKRMSDAAYAIANSHVMSPMTWFPVRLTMIAKVIALPNEATTPARNITLNLFGGALIFDRGSTFSVNTTRSPPIRSNEVGSSLTADDRPSLIPLNSIPRRRPTR